MPIKVAKFQLVAEQIAGLRITVKNAQQYTFSPYPQNQEDMLSEKIINENTDDVLTHSEVSKELSDLANSLNKEITELRSGLEAARALIHERELSLISRDDSSLAEAKSFTKQEVRAVVDSLANMSPAEAEDLFSVPIANVVQKLLAIATAPLTKKIEELEAKINTLGHHD